MIVWPTVLGRMIAERVSVRRSMRRDRAQAARDEAKHAREAENDTAKRTPEGLT
jgi:hypothetical protein